MIKICYIIGQLIKHGAEGQLCELVKGIDREKFCPIVISLSQGGYWISEIQRLNIQVIEIRRRKHKEFTRLFKLIKILKTIKPDIVHTYLVSANSYGRVASILTRVPIIIASERSLPEIGKDKNMFQICIDKLLALFSHGIICNSKKASDTLIKKYFYDAKKVFIIHNGIGVNGFLKKINLNREKLLGQKVVVTIGTLYHVKNHRLFLDMTRTILDMSGNKSMKFLIVGDGPLRGELEEYSKALGIEHCVIFTGERNDIPDILQNTDIFVMTSLYEGISNAIIEAMLSGLPVVATDVGGNSELVIDGETGFLCPLNDAKILAKRIFSLINDEDEAKRMGENGRKKILNEFRVDMMVKKTENIYMKLLGQQIF